MYELKIRWEDGSTSSVFKHSFDAYIQAAARDAKRRNMKYEIT